MGIFEFHFHWKNYKNDGDVIFVPSHLENVVRRPGHLSRTMAAPAICLLFNPRMHRMSIFKCGTYV